jgi:hypothetical protein
LVRRLPLCLAALILLAHSPLAAATKKGTATSSLDLRLPDAALATPESSREPRGYALTLRDDPWRAFAEEIPLLAGGAIPQPGSAERNGALDDGISLRGLLDGETIPLLRIRLSPER